MSPDLLTDPPSLCGQDVGQRQRHESIRAEFLQSIRQPSPPNPNFSRHQFSRSRPCLSLVARQRHGYSLLCNLSLQSIAE